ncbi:hypothetical protein J6590_102356, partial [Homalodisca vitripennis]
MDNVNILQNGLSLLLPILKQAELVFTTRMSLRYWRCGDATEVIHNSKHPRGGCQTCFFGGLSQPLSPSKIVIYTSL